MARISQSLIARMANPEWGQNLGRGIEGLLTGIGDRHVKNREDEAMAQILTQAQSADTSDPKVMNSIMATARQAGVDPLEVQKQVMLMEDQKLQRERQAIMLKNQQEQLRLAQERAEQARQTQARQEELHPYRVAAARLQQSVAEQNQMQEQVTNTSRAVLASAGTEGFNNYLNSLDSDDAKGVAQAERTRWETANTNLEIMQGTLQTQADKRTKFSDAILNEAETILGPEAIESYNAMTQGNQANVAQANAMLTTRYKEAIKSGGMAERSLATKLSKPLTKAVIEQIDDFAKEVANPGWLDKMVGSKQETDSFDPVVPEERQVKITQAVTVAAKLGAVLTDATLKRIRDNVIDNVNPLSGVLAPDQIEQLSEMGYFTGDTVSVTPTGDTTTPDTPNTLEDINAAIKALESEMGENP